MAMNILQTRRWLCALRAWLTPAMHDGTTAVTDLLTNATTMIWTWLPTDRADEPMCNEMRHFDTSDEGEMPDFQRFVRLTSSAVYKPGSSSAWNPSGTERLIMAGRQQVF